MGFSRPRVRRRTSSGNSMQLPWRHWPIRRCGRGSSNSGARFFRATNRHRKHIVDVCGNRHGRCPLVTAFFQKETRTQFALSRKSFAGIPCLAKRINGVSPNAEIGTNHSTGRIESAVQQMRGRRPQINRVAIGPRTSSPADTDAPIRSSGIFKDDGLSKRRSHPLGHDTPEHISGAARSSRHDHGDRASRIGLRRCDT
jgi:hypothetical protein